LDILFSDASVEGERDTGLVFWVEKLNQNCNFLDKTLHKNIEELVLIQFNPFNNNHSQDQCRQVIHDHNNMSIEEYCTQCSIIHSILTDP
jgi:hypothetical protein